MSIIQSPVKKEANRSQGLIIPITRHGQAWGLWVALTSEFGGLTNMTSGVTP